MSQAASSAPPSEAQDLTEQKSQQQQDLPTQDPLSPQSVHPATGTIMRQAIELEKRQNPLGSLQSLHPMNPAVTEMTEILKEDTTRPTTATVKMTHCLEPTGDNFRLWTYDLVTSCVVKECIEAIQKPLPKTRANAAALMLILSSTPKQWGGAIALQPSAFEALAWITKKFQGGFERGINKVWLRRLEGEGMTREETFDLYVQRKYELFQNLVNNHAQIDEEDLIKAIVNNLPAELESCRNSLYGACEGKTMAGVIKSIRVHAHGKDFDDHTPRPLPKVAAAVPKKTSTHNQADDRRTSRREPRCWECGRKGHIARDCKRWSEDSPGTSATSNASKATHADLSDDTSCDAVPCPRNVTQTLTLDSVVTLNVLEYSQRGLEGGEWLVDSGATVHLVNDFGLLHNPVIYAEARKLQLATDEVQGSIIGSGSVCLINAEGKPLWIHNVQCVPQAGTNLLYVSAGVSDGITFVPRSNGTYHSMVGPGGWECRISEQYTILFGNTNSMVCIF